MDAETIVVRRMAREEACRVAEVLVACYRAYAETGELSPEEAEALVEGRASIELVRADAETQTCLVADIGGRIAGVAAVRGNEITRLYVHPDRQGRGVGALLFRAAEDEIRRAGYGELIVGAVVESPLPFYEKMGMGEFARRRAEEGPLAGKEVVLLRKPLK